MSTMINKIASDLGIYRFENEQMNNFKCRVIYSAMSSWIKAIAMDHPVGSKENHLSGVSRKHIYERGNTVLQSFTRMYPEIKRWFETEPDAENPVELLRSRLINHGDLLNEGFDTNLALSVLYSKQFISFYETVYGAILSNDIEYSGIATLRKNSNKIRIENVENAGEWLDGFIRKIWWSSVSEQQTDWMYFDPTSKSKNNYLAWSYSIPSNNKNLVLARNIINKNEYEYYLLKPSNNLMHRIDPFLKGQGYHISIMYALRDLEGNNVTANVKVFNDHIHLKLNTHLPMKVRLMLESYAWPENHINDKLCWIMYDYVWNYIKPHLEMIGLQIVEDTYG